LSVLSHPPYSPDLAPSDFWLFNYIKTRLSDHNDVQSLYEAVTEILENVPKDEYLKAFKKWKERMELCIKHEGKYFEHLLI